MDIFDFNNIKSKNSDTGLLNFHNFKNIHKLFRLTELCLCIVLLSWTSFRLPLAVKISGEFLRWTISIIISPISVFIISNAIVLTLLFKSGHLSSHSPLTLASQDHDIYTEYFTGTKTNNKDLENIFRQDVITNSVKEPEAVTQKCGHLCKKDEVIYDNKEIIYEENHRFIEEHIMEVDGTSGKRYRRSKSEKLEKDGILVKGCKELRRSETEKCRKGEYEEAEEEEEKVYLFDKLSNEEFQKAIDEFIAKQVKFHEEEKSAIVLHNQA